MTPKAAPTDAAILAELSPVSIVALTIYGEADTTSLDAMRDVASVIHNRRETGRWGTDYQAVCLAPWQFSCWKKEGGLANYNRVRRAARVLWDEGERSEALQAAVWVAQGIVSGMLKDSVKCATHYYAPAAMVPAGRPPSWAKNQTPVLERAGHRFYTGIA